jgi:hypothetical protein
MTNKIPARYVLALLSVLTLGSGSAWAQTAPSPSPAGSGQAPSVDDETIVLSPFVVDASEDKDGYLATSTLAGTRIRTDLRDVASAISVVTAQFLKDTGAKNAQDLLVYTTNTEVGGVHGNFSGAGGSQTYSESGNLLHPNNNTRVRGLDSADNTRDYFLTEIPWDGYNVDRVDLQRGPNSILFGVGSPAGIINTSLNGAAFKNANKFENRIGQYGSVRNSLDINYVVLPRTLAIRVAALDDDTNFRQKPAFNNDRRAYGAVRFDPKLFGENAHTSITVNFEKGDVKANRPRSLPPVDAITPWFKTGNDPYGYPYANKITPDGTKDWTKYTANPNAGPNNVAPWYSFGAMGRLGNPDMSMYYDYNNSLPQRVQASTAGTALGIDQHGVVDGTIGGIQFGTNFALPSFNTYARQVIPGGAFYGNVSLSDPSIYDFYNNLMDGDNKREYNKWTASNFSLSQDLFANRLGFQYSYDYQRYRDGQIGFLNGGEYVLSVDINATLLDGSANPNVGRPYVGNSGQYGNTENYVNRDSHRLTVYGDLRSEDFLNKGWLTKILGHHVITGLLSQDLKRTDYRGFAHWASEPAYTEDNGIKPDLTTGPRQVDWIAYLGDSLMNASTASGAHINRIQTTIAPAPFQTVRYFDSHWNAPNVNPADPYTYVSYTNTDPEAGEIGGPVTNTGTQADNPANYVGWMTKTYGTLSSDRGDIASLYTSGQKNRNQIKSTGIVWQGHMFDDTVVPVFGWRKDTVKNASTQAPKDPTTAVSSMNYSVDSSDANTKTASGISKSYGIVIKTPVRYQNVLPFGTHFSVFANQSENFKADAPRGDIFGNVIPNPTGKTKDYGFLMSTMHDKVSLKVTWYDTKIQNATLSGDSAGFSGSLYYAWAIPYWGATHALAALDGVNGYRQGDWGWPWNGVATLTDGSPDNARIAAIADDFFKNFPLDQHFADEYGLGMNVAAMRAATTDAQRYASVPTYGVDGNGVYDTVGGTGAANLGLQPLYAGNLKDFGTGPVAAGDTTSKGIEIEITARPTENWNFTLNASKTEASRTSVSPSIDTWIASMTQFLDGDAGLLKLWGGDTFRKVWADNILAPYSVLKGQLGLTAPEIPKWRANVITGYNFSSGALKGSNIGFAYRWEDKRILGYQLNATKTVLDVTKPWYGPDDQHFDFWVGYGRKISSRINWRIQLNLRNVGERAKLVPVNIQPDGSVALSRIQDGMGWQITNTFEF